MTYKLASNGKSFYVNEKLLIEIDKISGDTIKGRLVSNPKNTPELKLNQIVTFQKKDITNLCVILSWMYEK